MKTLKEKLSKYDTFIEDNSNVNLGVDLEYAKRAKEDLKNHEIPTEGIELVSGKNKDFAFALLEL
jgi:hypothetical protein